ncbi:DUF86 domain-containing protein [Actinomyces viscosus]|uniref:HepT-like ribonuclease domain-containing protein n=1 Tax=Actinomyces viscosus TaxID=1656 RepID=UPI0036F27625
MPRDDASRLRDIIAAVDLAVASVDRISDPIVYAGIIYELAVIGEAANRLTAETRQRAPEVPWEAIVGFRNLSIHEYFRIDDDVVEEIARTHLTVVRAACERLL